MSESFRAGFLHPRYFGTWTLLGVLAITYLLPRRAAMAIGAAIGRQFYRRNRKRRDIARINIGMCFPDLEPRQRERMVLEHFEFYGRNVVDFGLVWWASRESMERWIEFRGVERLDAANRAGRGVILVTPHAVGMDIGGVSLGHRYENPMSMMKRAPDPFLNWLLQRGRERSGGHILLREEGLRPLVRGLRAGAVCYFIPDEDFGPEQSVFAPFFGVSTATLPVVGRLVRLTGAAVLPMVTWLDPASGMYHVEVGEALDGLGGDDVADATLVNAALERCVRRAPAQYMWTLKWFKTRPDGAPSPYDVDDSAGGRA